MNAEQPSSQHPDSLAAAVPGATTDPRIQLAEVPVQPRPPAQATLVTPVQIPLIPSLAEPEEEQERPAAVQYVQGLVSPGYFDPFKAFAHKVDWPRFFRSQAYLLVLGLAAPFFTLLLLGALMALLYSSGAALASATSPSPFWQIALFPFAFVLVKGYWVAYLLLTLSITALAWGWAGLSAWLLTRSGQHSLVDGRRAFAILAAMGAMLAPFATFDFLRILALGALLWFSIRRFRNSFEVPASAFLKTGGLTLLAATIAFGAFERKLEGWFNDGPGLAAELASLRRGKGLAWPQPKPPEPPAQAEKLLEQLASFDPTVRERVTVEALNFAKAGSAAAESRFQVSHRLAELGHAEAMLLTANAYRNGVGTAADTAAARTWYAKAAEANPRNPSARMEQGSLLIQEGRRLEGKRLLVALAKDQPDQISRIADFIQKNGHGRSNFELSQRVAALYKGLPSAYGVTYSPARGGERRVRGEEDDVQAQINASDREGGMWFYRALVAELSRMEHASATVYGELDGAAASHDLETRAAMGDRNALEILGERAYRDGNIAKARESWLKAARNLEGDNRNANMVFYLKLAESYDPAKGKGSADPKEATRWYLAALLVGAGMGQSNPEVLQSLQRLGANVPPDPRSHAFLEMAVKLEVPEACAMMADRCLAGDFVEAPKHPARARELLLKAESLGYRSDWMYQNLAILDPEQAAKWRRLAAKR